MKTSLGILAAITLFLLISGTGMASPLCHMSSEARYVGFINQDDFDKFKQFVEDEDFDTGDRFFMELIMLGKATRFEKGESVYVEDFGGFLIGDMQIRRPGEMESYWTYHGAAECPQQ
ncbi:MAG: hypothetical protein WCW68_10630 [Methanothrix sp.]